MAAVYLSIKSKFLCLGIGFEFQTLARVFTPLNIAFEIHFPMLILHSF